MVFTSQSDSTSGIQFDIQYDPTQISLGVTVGDAARNSGKTLSYFDLAPNTRRFLILGLNQNVIPTGVLINLFLSLNPNSAEGLYPLSFVNVSAVTPDGNSAPATGLDGSITVQGTSGSVVSLELAGVLSGASLLPGPIAPGEFVTLIGSAIGPAIPAKPAGSASSTVLGGTQVLFDGTPAPLLFASWNQINLVVPFGLYGKSSTALQIVNGSVAVTSLPVPVVAAAPAILTVDQSGAGQGAILNQDSSPNGWLNPAATGTIATLYATGAGQTDPPGVDGQVATTVFPTPLLPVSVQVGGLNADILYAAAAPTLIAGILQVDFRIPSGVSPGNAVPVILTVGSGSSQTGVTLVIQ